MIHYLLYLIEVSISLALFYVIYLCLVKDDTFHKLKRFYLLSSIVISLVIPKLPSNNLTRGIEKSIIPKSLEYVSGVTSQDNFDKIVFGGISNQTVIQNEERKPVNLLSLLLFLYFIGVGYMFFRLIANLFQIVKLVKSNKQESYGKYSIISLPYDHPTFSFHRYIFLNDRSLNINDKRDVLSHEVCHLKQGHSIDIIFIEACKILLWFNPMIGHYKKSVSKVHECLADEYVVGLKSDCLDDYQSLLLKQYLSNIKIELAHPFNYSLIKFRIDMMTKTKSKWWAKYKLIFAIPVIGLSLAAFTNEQLSPSLEEISAPGSPQSASVAPQSTTGISQPVQDTILMIGPLDEPSGWNKSSPIRKIDDFKVGTDIQIFQHGKNGAFIESVVKNPTGYCSLSQHFGTKEFKGKRVKMTGFVKSQGLNVTSTMFVNVNDYDKMISVDADEMADRQIVGTKDWTKLEIIFDVPDARGLISCGFKIKGEGKIWVDNVSFQIVSSSVSKTAHNQNQAIPAQGLNFTIQNMNYIDWLQLKLPVNLDFEELSANSE